MKKANSYLSNLGFTMIELLLLISVIGALTIIGTPYLFGSLEKKRLLTERDTVVSALKYTQQQSKVAEDGKRHGLRFSQDSFSTLPDERTHTFGHNIKLAQFDSPTIFFEKLTGFSQLESTQEVLDLELVLVSDSFLTRIHVNAYGVIEVSSPEKRDGQYR